MTLEEIKKNLIIAIKKNNGLPLDVFFSPWLEYYYNHENIFGTAGDFITAPDISPVFGLLLGLRVAVEKKETNYHLLEIGGGRGAMMRDILNHAPQDFLQDLRITMIERSNQLARLQQKNLNQYQQLITWQESLASVETASVDFIIANEFFDCIIPRQFVMKDKKWFERVVRVDENCNEDGKEDGNEDGNEDAKKNDKENSGENRNDFYIDLVTNSEEATQLLADLTHWPAKENVIYEQHGGYGLMLAEMARVLKPNGIITIIDYGNDGIYDGDNLQSLYRHRPIDILQYLGHADISASVGFREAAIVANNFNLKKIYFDNQKNFLQNLHGDKIAEKLIELGYDKDKMMAGYQRLIKDNKPSDMGRLFKIMELQKT